jgi:hypothetical protein
MRHRRGSDEASDAARVGGGSLSFAVANTCPPGRSCRWESVQRAAPVIAAGALLAHGMHDDVVLAYVQRTWKLHLIDARAAVAAAHTIAGDRHGIAIAPNPHERRPSDLGPAQH